MRYEHHNREAFVDGVIYKTMSIFQWQNDYLLFLLLVRQYRQSSAEVKPSKMQAHRKGGFLYTH